MPCLARRGPRTLPTLTVASEQAVSFSASYGGLKRTDSVTILPPGIDKVILTPTSIVGGNGVNIRVFITGRAPKGGLTVSLSSNTKSVILPETVTVKEGANGVAFSGQSLAVAADEVATITASIGSSLKSSDLKIARNSVVNINMSPNPTKSSSAVKCSVTLAAPAGPGGVTVTISSNQGVVAPESTSVVIAEGQTKGSLNLIVGKVTSVTTATITATANDKSFNATLTIRP